MKCVCLCIIAGLLLTGVAFPQASGNFSASGTSAACKIDATNHGEFTGGATVNLLSTDISVSSGSGVTLKITPALVTGLFTQTKIDTTVPSASADIGIQVCVTVDDKPDGVKPASCVVYDERFQQVSSQLFSALTACTITSCTTTADCTAAGSTGTCYNPGAVMNGGTCVVPVPGTTCADTSGCAAGQVCIVPTGSMTGVCNQQVSEACNFDLILSTLSAHSFDFVISNTALTGGKTHTVTAEWSVIGAGASGGNASVLSCVGPGILDVVQTKVFNNSGGLSF